MKRVPPSLAQTCATCVWWRRQGPKLSKAVRDPSAARDTGTCQLHAPVVVQMHSAFAEALFPVTHESRFCGDWDGVDEGGGGDDGECIIAFPIARKAA